jgi:hypothetical protein
MCQIHFKNGIPVSTDSRVFQISGNGINPVDTLWLGAWNGGAHLEYIYNDNRKGVGGVDSAMGFSYQNIDLAPGEAKEFIVRFTLSRTED